MTYWALGCVQKCDLWAWQRKKKDKLSCVKLAICPDHPRRCRPLKFCMRGRVREVVIYFKFHENRSRGLGAVGGRKSPSPMAYTTACTTVQAVILTTFTDYRQQWWTLLTQEWNACNKGIGISMLKLNHNYMQNNSKDKPGSKLATNC